MHSVCQHENMEALFVTQRTAKSEQIVVYQGRVSLNVLWLCCFKDPLTGLRPASGKIQAFPEKGYFHDDF